jgi:CheY-like chemotaxis protein
MPGSQSNQISAKVSNHSANVPAVQPSALSVDRLLIIDDSNRVSSLLVTGIIKACNLCGRPYQIIQSGPTGLIETNYASNADSNASSRKPLIIYTANNPRNALPVLDLAGLSRLIIISDIMMPNDTEVGLVGLMQELADRRLPVSLIFASSEKQNRYYVEEILQTGKAQFVEKGGTSWGDLPFLLTEQTDRFPYKIIMRGDYDRAYTRNNVEAAPKPSAPVRLQPVTAQGVATGKVGLWSRLAFWRSRR